MCLLVGARDETIYFQVERSGDVDVLCEVSLCYVRNVESNVVV